MVVVQLKKGEHLVRKGEPAKAIYIVLHGSVNLQTAYNQITLGTGSVVGFMSGFSDVYICDYVAAEDSLIASYKYESPEDYKVIFKEQPMYCYAFLHAAMKQYRMIYDSYKALEDDAKEISDLIAKRQGDFDRKEVEIGSLGEIFLPEPIHSWEIGYFRELVDMPEKNLRYFYNEKEDLTIGVLLQLAEIMSRMIANMDVLEEYMQRARDFLSYMQSHQTHAMVEENEDGEEAETLTREQVLKTDFTTYIMKYAGYEKEDIAACKKLLSEYGEIAEIQDYTPETQKTRRDLTKIFYEIYKKAFLRAVHARTISIVMKLFFNFGILDLQMAGEQHLDELMTFCELLDNQWKNQKERDAEGESFSHVYSAYQWLCLVYRGEKEPSKNEFDVDYTGHLLEMRKNHEITREEENELKRDQLKKVDFEICNMFMTNNRITYGRITTFCPVLHKKDFIRSIDQLAVSAVTINAAIDNIRELDYSCFYREVFFASPEYGIERTEIMKEVLPDVILMPNIGSKAMMWQETSGVKRDTPARFVFPVMTSGEMPDMMLETIGRYRWEICRKILGVRWNDIREKSLTSEFYDYVQFYRKNRDLSQQAKEKVKADLVHAKNNYREVFVSDYMGWMKYESQGNFRLNKVSRRIISEYVPFKPEVRKKLEENPMYRELFAKSNILADRKREKEKVLFDRYVAAGGTITPELEAHLKYHGIQM